MNVYIIIYSRYEDFNILGVFSSRDKAIEAFKSNVLYFEIGTYRIVKCDLDKFGEVSLYEDYLYEKDKQ